MVRRRLDSLSCKAKFSYLASLTRDACSLKWTLEEEDVIPNRLLLEWLGLYLPEVDRWLGEGDAWWCDY